MATTLLIIAATVWYGIFAFPLPWKVIDTASPRFRIEQFRLTDYPNANALGTALNSLFPVGTSKEKVDAVLVRAGAHIKPLMPAKTQKPPFPNAYYYTHRNWRSILGEIVMMAPSRDEFAWKALIYFDQNNDVKKIVAIGP